jgi:hypothetical protein
MWQSKQQKLNEARLEQMRQSLLHAVDPSEDEIAAIANAPELYERVRARITAEQARRARAQADKQVAVLPPFAMLLNGLKSARWALAAATVSVALFALAWQSESLTPVHKTLDTQANVAPITSTPPAPAAAPVAAEKSAAAVEKEGVTSQPAGIRHVHAAHRRTRAVAPEVMTEFLPLTYVSEAAQETGQVVRVRIPRATLASFGLPVNAERVNELIKADILIGDDGLARAIRFVQ